MIYVLLAVIVLFIYIIVKLANRNIFLSAQFKVSADNYIKLYEIYSQNTLNYSNALKDVVKWYTEFYNIGKNNNSLDDETADMLLNDRIKIQRLIETVYEPNEDKATEFLNKMKELKGRME